MIEKADKIFQSTCIFDSVSEEAYPGYVAIKGKQISRFTNLFPFPACVKSKSQI